MTRVLQALGGGPPSLSQVTSERCRVGLVYLNYNSSSIMAAIRSALAQDYPREIITMWVVDNGSDYRNLQALRSYLVSLAKHEAREVHLVSNVANLGFGRGMNRGIFEAFASGCEVVICSNPDVVMKSDCVRHMATSALTDSRPSLCFAQAHTLRDRDSLIWRRRRIHSSGGHLFAINRPFIQRIGLFDEDFFLYGEDLDLFDRARWGGAIVKTIPEAVMSHWEGTIQPEAVYTRLNTSKIAAFQTFHFCRSGMIYLRKKRRRGSLCGRDLSFMARIVVGHMAERLAKRRMTAPLYAGRGLLEGVGCKLSGRVPKLGQAGYIPRLLGQQTGSRSSEAGPIKLQTVGRLLLWRLGFD